eukprot:TRINITY_DN667_c0_g1_i2.p2 TRINITY_DN667_c0_g1~~TRINITY_DN667_c0_g1_i2.p2  ORF type:complete len:435 (-),score=51.68 TRINITY_DN667_c0_g1_i2:2823-4127(-)
MGQYKTALEYAGKALNLLEESTESATKATVEYVYAVCCSKFADSHKYACEKTHLKEEARKNLEVSMVENPKHAMTIYFLAREAAESGDALEAVKFCEQSLKYDQSNTHCLALYALALTMQGNFSKAYVVADEGYKRGKMGEMDQGYPLIGVIRSELEIYQALNAQKTLAAHEKDCLRAIHGYKALVKDLSRSQHEIEQKEEDSKKAKETTLLMQTMREDCLKNYEEVIRSAEEEYSKAYGGRLKKYKIGDKTVESVIALISIMQYYVKACIRLGDLDRATAGFEKITKDYCINSPSILFLVICDNNAQQQKALIEIEKKYWDDAIKTLDGVTQEDPYLTEAVVKLAEIECKIYRNYQKALGRISHAIKVDPDFPEIYVVLQEIYQAMGDTESALEASFKGMTLAERTPLLNLCIIPKVIIQAHNSRQYHSMCVL